MKENKKFLELDIHEYSRFIEGVMKNKPNDDYLKKINDILLKSNKKNPNKTLKLLEINLNFFDTYSKTLLYSMTLESMIKVYINMNDPGKVLEFFKKYIQNACRNNMTEGTEPLIEHIMAAFSKMKLKEDDYIQFIKYQTDFYSHSHKFDKSISLMCECAYHFASNHAYQSAYRLLNDAQNIALSNNLLECQLKVLITQATICLQEQDFDAAERDFETATNLADMLNQKIPFYITFNIATLKLRRGDYKNALIMIEKMLSDTSSIKKEHHYGLLINKAVCLREVGRLDESIKLIEEVLQLIETAKDLELILEAHLIAAKIYLMAEEYAQCLYHVNESIEIIDFNLQFKNRLHYRRGFKEQYLPRIISMFFEISFENCEYESVTGFLAFSKSNIFSDWLSLLDWYDNVMDDDLVKSEDKKRLENSLGKLINFGAPVMNGFREKYDDPFESIDDPRINPNGIFDFNKPWKDFNLLMEKITLNYEKHRNPYEKSSIYKLKEYLDRKINNGACIISVYTVNGSIAIFVVLKDSCTVVKLDIDIYLNYFKDLFQYQNKFISFPAFIKSLNLVTDPLLGKLENVIESIILKDPKEIIILQDKLSYCLPLIPALLSNAIFREHLEKDNVILKTSPIVYKEKSKCIQYDRFLGIIDPAEELPLLPEELNVAIRYFKEHNQVLNLKNEKINYDDMAVKDADIIHIGTHGYPISRYTDPTYASVAGELSKSSITFEEIQGSFWKLSYSLCINASCDSSDITNRNFQRMFNTNELIGYSTMFLLNRKSSVISVNWPIKDLLSYTFTNIFYENLSKYKSIERAFTLSLVDLYNVDKHRLKAIVENICDETVRQQKLRLVDNLQCEFPFRNPYCYGAFTVNSLI